MGEPVSLDLSEGRRLLAERGDPTHARVNISRLSKWFHENAPDLLDAAERTQKAEAALGESHAKRDADWAETLTKWLVEKSALKAKAQKAEAERDAALKEVERLKDELATAKELISLRVYYGSPH